MKRLCLLFPVLLVLNFCGFRQVQVGNEENFLAFRFEGRYGQVEVGGRYVGVEFHHSRPVPSRISFYYPVANSIDLSTDYWKREESTPLVIGIKVDGEEKRWIGKEPWAYELSPHRVTFQHRDEETEYSAAYEFCFSEPAMVLTINIRNRSNRRKAIEIYTHLLLSLRTCHTYALKDSSWTEADDSLHFIAAHFDDRETDRASIFVQNVGARPTSWTSRAEELRISDEGSSLWIKENADFQHRLLSQQSKGRAVGAFLYKDELEPQEEFRIIQIVGSCRRSEVRSITTRLASSWRQQTAEFDDLVRVKALKEAIFVTWDSWLDRSAAWARGVLAANAHYLNGAIVPMPCPAEYNFFFTHDLLLTDLGAVRFDAKRVRDDLIYVASLAEDNIIPHAYYWKDNGFKTEYATPDNWNHLWFILVTGSYLRHSMDDSTGQVLYPLVSRSVEEILKQRKQDNLMYGFRPDWWDIGHVEGPRAYLTILTIRALREYLYINAMLDKSSLQLIELERLADSMQTALTTWLWDTRSKYLMDWNGEVADRHYYMGPLLAPAFGLLDSGKAEQLVETAGRELVDNRIGVRAVMPPDFHTDASIAFYKFAGDEAGQPFCYINGGVWPHNNAWYALALKSIGKSDEALRFVKSTMSLDGVAQSPLGAPAMFEYRFSDPASPEFGKIDKPSFLWAGGFYLYTLYNLFGVKENEWNVSITGPLPAETDSVCYSLTMGRMVDVQVKGKGEHMQSVTTDGIGVPSLVLPTSVKSNSLIRVAFGQVRAPYIRHVNAILHTAEWNERERVLTARLASFAGHQVKLDLVGLEKPSMVLLDGKPVTDVTASGKEGDVQAVRILFVAGPSQQLLEVKF